MLAFLQTLIPPDVKPLLRFLRILAFLRIFSCWTTSQLQPAKRASLEFKAPNPASPVWSSKPPTQLHSFSRFIWGFGLQTARSASVTPHVWSSKPLTQLCMGSGPFFGALDFKQPGAHRLPCLLEVQASLEPRFATRSGQDA